MSKLKVLALLVLGWGLIAPPSSFAVNKVKPLIVSSGKRKQLDAQTDYVTAKGYSFANSDATYIDEDTGAIKFYTNTTLACTIDTGGDFTIPGHMALGNNSSVSTTNVLNIDEAITSNQSLGGGGIYTNISNVDATGNTVYSLDTLSSISGTGKASNILGITSGALNDSSVGGTTSSKMVGGSFYSNHTGTGASTEMYGLESYVYLDNSFGTPTSGTAYAGRFGIANSGGTITTGYGVYIDSVTGQATTPWSIASNGGNSYHLGNFSIGSSSAPVTPLSVNGSGSSYSDFLSLSRTSSIRASRTETSSLSGADSDGQMHLELKLNPSSSYAGLATNAFTSFMLTESGNSQNFTTLGIRAGNFLAGHQGTGTVSNIQSFGSGARNTSTGTVTAMSGVTLGNINNGGGTVTLNETLSISTPTGRTSGTPNSTWGTVYGINIKDQNPTGSSNTLTNVPVALKIQNQAGTGAYAIQAGTGLNYLAGDTSIGSTSAPTVALDVTGSIKSSALTSGRVVFSTTGGQLTDASNFTFSGGSLGVATLGATDYVNGNLFGMSGTIYEYNAIPTEGIGVPPIRDQVNLTAQGAAISATNMYTAPADGMYRITAIAKVTRVATTSSTLGTITIGYTHGVDATAQNQVMHCANEGGGTSTTVSGNTTSSKLTCTAIVYANASSNITYAVGYASSGATSMQYALSIRTEEL